MFRELSRKHKLIVFGLCIANSLVGMGIGWGLRYIHPPVDTTELQTQAWSEIGKCEPILDHILMLSDLGEDEHGNFSLPPKHWRIVKAALLIVKGELILRNVEGVQLEFPEFTIGGEKGEER